MDPWENSSEQNMCPPAINQIYQLQTLWAPMLEDSEIGGTPGTQQEIWVGTMHGEPEIGGINGIQQEIWVGTMHGEPEIGGHNGIQQEIGVGTMHHEPEIGGTNGIQQEIWVGTTYGEPEIGGTNGIQQVYHQLGRGQSPGTPVGTILEAVNIGGPNETQQEAPMGRMNGGPVIGGTGIQGAKRQLFEFEDGNKLNNLRSENLSGHHQAFSIPRKAQKALGFGGTELPECNEEKGASQTYQNQHSPYAGEQTDRTVRKKKVIPRACVLNQQNENILSCKSGSDANNLNGKAVLGSLTQKERKRLIDRRYRANVKAKTQKVLDDFESVSKENVELKEQLLLLKNNGQLNVSSKRKAVFELNFDSVENKAEAMKMVGGFPDMVKITLNVKKRRLKLKGDFDVEALLRKLKTCCDARLVSKEDVSAMPGSSTSASLRVSAVQLR